MSAQTTTVVVPPQAIPGVAFIEVRGGKKTKTSGEGRLGRPRGEVIVCYAAVDECFETAVKQLSWHRSKKGYIRSIVDKKMVLLHDVVYALAGKPPLAPGETLDHIDRHPHNNVLTNLRVASPTLQMLNRGSNKNNTTGFRGVFRAGRYWSAGVKVAYKRLGLGTYETAEAAAWAVNEYYRQNFPDVPLPNPNVGEASAGPRLNKSRPKIHQARNECGFRGVFKRKDRANFCARVYSLPDETNKKHILLCRAFPTAEEAARAVNDCYRKHFPGIPIPNPTAEEHGANDNPRTGDSGH